MIIENNIESDHLISLLNSGHLKLIPLKEDGLISEKITEEDRKKIKEEDNIEIPENVTSWFTFIDKEPLFWTCQKLADPYYARKFKNVAKTNGYCGIDQFNQRSIYDLAFDIDSDYAFDVLNSPSLLEREDVKEFINRYSHLLVGQPYTSLFDFLKKITYVTKTRKENGYHIYWKEYSKFDSVESQKCHEEKRFEIFTGKHLLNLPPSRHRDDANFRYSTASANTVKILDGLYNLLRDLLKDCLIEKRKPVASTNNLSYKNLVNSNSHDGQLVDESIAKLAQTIRPFYRRPNRHRIVLALAGILFKSGFSEQKAIDIISKISEENGDEEKNQRISIVKATYAKGVQEGTDNIAGISLLSDIVQSQIQYEGEVQIVQQPDDFTDKVLEEVKQILLLPTPTLPLLDDESSGGIDISSIIPFSIRQELSPHIYKITSINPLRLIVSHRHYRQILSARLKKEKRNDEDKGVETCRLEYGDILIDTIPSQIIIYDNAIDKTRKYEITFLTNVHANSDKNKNKSKGTFTIGPSFLDQIVSELQSRNKILKKSNVNDTLSAIISASEQRGLAIINDKISNPRFFIVDDKLVAIETNQQTIDLQTDETITSKDKEQILSCIDLLEELNKRWQKGVFPTVLRWAIMSPFSFILKEKGNWMPYLFLYGWSNAGKSTLGLIILAIWRKNHNKEIDQYIRGFTSIGTEARFGSIISRDTYPRIINEVGSLSNPYYQNIVEAIKNAVENVIAKGRIENYRNYVNIPSLSPLVLTSNKNPPADDTGFKRRMISIHFDKTDSKDEKEAKRFEQWLKNNLHLLEVLGDFAYSYLNQNQHLLKEGNLKANEISKIILKTFYKLAKREQPDWIDDFVEQNTIQQNKEDVTIELRSFLLNEINNCYNKYYKTFADSTNEPSDASLSLNTIVDRLNFCLNNQLIPYLYIFKNKQGEENIAITSDILKELKKRDVRSLHSLKDIENEIPNFKYDSRRLGERSIRIAFGPKRSFLDFINREISNLD